MTETRGIKPLVVLLLLAALAALAAACDPGEIIHYRNNTNEPLFVEINEHSGLDRLPPGKSRNLTYLATRIGSGDDPLHILVVDEQGCTVVDMLTTVARFRKEQDFKLVIDPGDLPPPAARTPCDPVLADIATRTQE